MKRFLFVAVASLLVLGACKSLDSIPSSIPLGFVTVQMSDAPSTHRTSPTAYFVDATNVSIPNSGQNADTCAEIGYPGSQVVSPLAQIDAGTPLVFATTLDTAQLTPSAADANGYIFYRLPTGDSLRIVPGSTSRITIPGVSNGFHAFNFTFTNADSLKIQPLQASPDSVHDLPVTWNPQNGASVVLQLEFGATPSSINTQIFCQFTDNGSHAVQASLANAWRTAAARRVHAYRFLTTFNNDGTDEVVVVSTYGTDNTVILP
ncbi:MAG: hypothetical protein H0U66_07770 [Gemmatimonadaceae bacterium]|nr:hypothetical protein [Gemmatimonadaceae bacterium]